MIDRNVNSNLAINPAATENIYTRRKRLKVLYELSNGLFAKAAAVAAAPAHAASELGHSRVSKIEGYNV